MSRLRIDDQVPANVRPRYMQDCVSGCRKDHRFHHISLKDFYQLIEFFEQSKIDFISITERFDTGTPAGRLLRNIMLTFAQFERELTSERTRDKLLERVKKGMWNGGTVPYGYERKNKKLIIHRKEAEKIKSIFETYLETGSISGVYDLLKDKDVRDRQGKTFSKPFLARILRNIIYTGKIKYAGQIYQGIHQPIISEELFELAQKIHKKRIRKFRIYKNFLFAGLINCKECGYKMSPCFTNKHKDGKLKRYYYYRCTCTNKKSWQACSTKQVSAERLEKYILENLERISIDRDYIENLVFKLNHSSNLDLKNLPTPQQIGLEPSQVYSKFSKFEPENVSATLKFFLSTLASKKRNYKNLLAKKFVAKIIYSPENIRIALFYSENSENFPNLANEKSPACQLAGGVSGQSPDKRNLVFFKKNQFVPNTTSALERIRTSTLCSEDKDDIHFTTRAIELFYILPKKLKKTSF